MRSTDIRALPRRTNSNLPQISACEPAGCPGVGVRRIARSLARQSAPSLACLLGLGPGVALLPALTAMIMLHLLRVLHPPGLALAMCSALLHSGAWFAILVVLPFTL